MSDLDFDWTGLRQRLDLAARAIDEHATPAAERVRAVLEARAAALAQTPEVPPDDLVELLVIGLDGDRYGIESRYVIEVCRLATMTPLPGAEPPLSAVTVWRGDLLVLLDLRRMLDRPTDGLGDRNRMLVLGDADAAFGVLVDRVQELVAVSRAAIGPVPERGEGLRYVTGVTENHVRVLEAAALLQQAPAASY